MSWLQELRSTVRDVHERLEELPFVAALAQGRISAREYLSLLVRLHKLHRVLERELARHPSLADVYAPSMNRTAAVSRDIGYLSSVHSITPDSAMQERVVPWHPTDELAERFETWSRLAPWKLLGALYVLEGSRMGSMVLAGPLADSLGEPRLSGHGIDYHLDRWEERRGEWQSFLENLETHPLDAAQQTEVIDAARETFDGFYAIYAGLGWLLPVATRY